MSIENFLDKKYQKFFSNQSKINDLISQMNAQNVNKVDIQSLKLVFMGEQSVGKSTALTHLMGKENIVPIKSDLGTKLATKVVFKKGGNEEVTIYLEGQQDSAKSVFQKTQYKEIQQKVLALNDSQGGDISDQAVIVIEYGGQNYNLEFYDLPGLRRDFEYKDKTENIAQKYMNDPNTIVLFCNSTDNNQSNAHSFFQELQEKRPQDTVVVLTKIDKGDTNVQNALQFLKLKENYRFAGYVIIIPRKNKANQFGDLSEEEFQQQEKSIIEEELQRDEKQRIKDLEEAFQQEQKILGNKGGLKKYSSYCGKENGLKQIYNIQFQKIIESKILQKSYDLMRKQVLEQEKEVKESNQMQDLLRSSDQDYLESQKARFMKFYENEFKISYFNLILGSQFQKETEDLFLRFAQLLQTVKGEQQLIFLMLKNTVSAFKYFDKNNIVQWFLQHRKNEFQKCFIPLIDKIKNKYEYQFKKAFEGFKIDYFVGNDKIISEYVKYLFGEIKADFQKIIEVNFQLDFIQQDYETNQFFNENEDYKDRQLKNDKKIYDLIQFFKQKQYQQKSGQISEQQSTGQFCICEAEIKKIEYLFNLTCDFKKNCQVHYDNVIQMDEGLQENLILFPDKIGLLEQIYFQGIRVFSFRDNLQESIDLMIEKNLVSQDKEKASNIQEYMEFEQREVDEVMIKSYLFFIDEIKGIHKQMNKIIYNHTKNFGQHFSSYLFNNKCKIWQAILQNKKDRQEEDLEQLEQKRERQEEFIQLGEEAMNILQDQISYLENMMLKISS